MRRRGMAIWVGACATSFACASVPPPRDVVARAEQAVERAEQEGANQHAPLPLRKAEDALARAKEALREERNQEARRAAELAEVQAELATATAQRANAAALVKELSRTVNALEEDTR